MRLLLTALIATPFMMATASSAFAQGSPAPVPGEQPNQPNQPETARPADTVPAEGSQANNGPTESGPAPVEVAPAPPPAPPPVETPVETPQEREARSRFEAGRALVQVGSFTAARTEFQRGFEFSERPLFLFNMAECARHLGQADVARREYSEYLRMEPAGSFSSIARERVQELGPGDTSTPEFVAAMRYPQDPPPAPSASLTAAAVASAETTASVAPPAGRKWYANWPFWTIVGVVVAGSAVAIALATRPGTPPCDQGCARIDWSEL